MSVVTSVKPKGKAAIPTWQMLQTVFPDVQCERRFIWLVLPRGDEASVVEARVRDALIDHCAVTQMQQPHPKKRNCTPHLLREKLTAPPRPQLEFDFFIPSHNLAIEFDERQHFTEERAVSLRCYGNEVDVHFDLQGWIGRCHAINATDPDPIWRDWQRSYRDAVRDIRAAQHGVRLLRIAFDQELTRDDLQVLGKREGNPVG